MATPGAPTSFDGSFAQPSRPQWNGAVQTPDGDNARIAAHQRAAADGSDAIWAGKQNARVFMAAARSQHGYPGLSLPPSASSSRLAHSPAQANGGPRLSRKRSRDGTQRPVSPAEGGADGGDDGAHRSHDPVLLDRYMQRDMRSDAALNDQTERSRELITTKERERDFYLHEVRNARAMHPGSVFGYGYMGYGNRTTEGKNMIMYSAQHPPPKGRRSRELRIARRDNAQQAEQHEELVPVRLDIELDKLRLRDTFTWNLHEKLISSDLFADYLLEDLKVPTEALPEVSRLVKAEMQEQIQNFYPHIIVEDGPLEPGRPYSDHKDDEMRIQIKLNITIGRVTLSDQFEWDINNPLNSPEEFARQMAWENALSGEFTTAIAHSIREQSQLYTKSLYLTNHCFDGRPVEDSDLRDSFLPAPIHSAFRPQQTQKDWMPYMYEMSEAEFERTETSMMREHRAQKRQLNRRGGPALPDLKDRQRTVRSLIMSSVIPFGVETFETTGILKTRRRGRGGRRAGRAGDLDVDSDDLESDESEVESPAPSAINAGTARTRGMRGAASAAQMAMRATYGNSATPEVMTPHETRTSTRRSMLREESVADDGDTLIVKLKVGKARLRAFWDDYQAKKRAKEYPLSGYASLPPPLTNLRGGTPAAARGAAAATTASTTPSATPRHLSRAASQPNGSQRGSSSTRGAPQYDQHGRVDMDHWPAPNDPPPPPPAWLADAIRALRDMHPESDFEPLMRPYAIDVATNKQTQSKPALEPGAPAPPGTRLQYLPRIRCNDCPGKLYTAVPGKVVDDFVVHLRNRNHRNQVLERQQQHGR